MNNYLHKICEIASLAAEIEESDIFSKLKNTIVHDFHIEQISLLYNEFVVLPNISEIEIEKVIQVLTLIFLVTLIINLSVKLWKERFELR